jgi:hypothetical protein
MGHKSVMNGGGVANKKFFPYSLSIWGARDFFLSWISRVRIEIALFLDWQTAIRCACIFHSGNGGQLQP